MRKPVTIAQKHEAIALAAVIGVEAAALQLGWNRRTVRGWCEAAGQRPELDAPTDELQRLYDLAVARVTVDVAAGKIKGSSLMTVVGIARDKLDRAARWKAARERVEAQQQVPEPPVMPWDAGIRRWEAHLATLDTDTSDLAIRWLREELDEEMERRDRDGEPEPTASTPEEEERLALIWHDLIDYVGKAIESGELRQWAAEQDVRDAERRALYEARNRQRSLAGRWLEDHEADLLIEAEQVLEEIA